MREWLGKFKSRPAVKRVGGVLGAIWRRITHNLGYKLLSILLAILLWSYVISNNSSITRTKTINGLTGYIRNQSVLSNYAGLALYDDLSEELTGISVVLELPQSDYSYATADNVQVSLDLSGVRTAGTQEVSLTATTSYGRVVRVVPDRLTLNFEPLDSRVIPVNVQLNVPEEQDIWCNVLRSTPQSLTIRGASSVVQRVSAAAVTVDTADAAGSFTVAVPYTLIDSSGQEVAPTMLERSTSSISVSVEVYPTRDIPISTEIAGAVSGQPAEGYVVESIAVQPETLTVAADQEILDGLEELYIEPISVDGASQSFSVRQAVSSLSAFKSISASEVYVNVTIAEQTASARLEDVPIGYVNLAEGLSIASAPKTASMTVTGPRSAVAALTEAGLTLSVDLTGAEAGSVQRTLSVPADLYPGLTFALDSPQLDIVIAADDAGEQEEE